MWAEPLTVSSGVVAPRLLMVTVNDGNNDIVVGVLVKFYVETSSAVLGEIQYRNRNGSAQQKVRAFVMLIRECIRRARAGGIENALADVKPWMRRIVERAAHPMIGPAENPGQWSGKLADLEAAVDLRTRADGTFRMTLAAWELADANDTFVRAGG